MTPSPPTQHILRQIELQPDSSYLTSQVLSSLGRYVSSMSERLRAYRQLREWEVNLMQELVDRLPAEVQQNVESLEQSSKFPSFD